MTHSTPIRNAHDSRTVRHQSVEIDVLRRCWANEREQRRRASARARGLMDVLPLPVLVLDRDRIVIDASAAALAGGCGPPKGLPPRAPGAPFIFNLVAFDEAAGTVTWRPADVRANRGPTGRLTKAQKEGRVVVAVGDVDGVRLWLDV